MLAEEFLKPLGMSNFRLAKEIGVPALRIGKIALTFRLREGAS
jgi:plasmid maintenance system antidote protein VapI